ncbi:hypothetical protein GCM10009556_092030 [Acrocarpospora pleiomorpha]
MGGWENPGIKLPLHTSDHGDDGVGRSPREIKGLGGWEFHRNQSNTGRRGRLRVEFE